MLTLKTGVGMGLKEVTVPVYSAEMVSPEAVKMQLSCH
jgi:hypothetical protein